jgi:hypothetical protein
MRLFLAVILIAISFIQFVFVSFALNFVRYGHANVQESDNLDYGMIGMYIITILLLIITSLSKEFYFLFINAIITVILFLGLSIFCWQISYKAFLFFSPNIIIILSILITNVVYIFWYFNKKHNDKI